MSKFSFIHLRVHSSYSLLEGAITVKKLPKLCLKHNMPAVALTDSNNLFGALEFSETLSESGIQPIVGIQIDLDLSEYFTDQKNNVHMTAPIILLAKNKNGYQNLLKIASQAYTVHSHKNALPFTTMNDLTQWHDDMIMLTGGQNGALGVLIQNQKLDIAENLLKTFQSLFSDNLYIELQRIGLDNESYFESVFLDYAYQYNIPIVATNDVMFDTPDMHNAHDALICIAAGTYISEQNRRHVSKEQYFKSPNDMVSLFHDLPEAIENTIEIAKRCAFKVEKHAPILPAFVRDGDLNAEAAELRRLAHDGLEKRLILAESAHEMFADKQVYIDRLDFELDVICKMQFPGYFLIVADFIQWAKSQNIPVGPGRGSGAGSVVAWALTITDLDPLRFGLLFERFLNPERVSMPDFDIDFCQDRREEVIEYVQHRYGHDRVAQIITFGKLQARAVMRDVGRVLQMPYGQVDRLCKMIPNNPARPTSIPEALESEEGLASAKRTDETVRTMLDIAIPLEGLYRHASTHAAGVVIADRPLDEIVPVYRDSKSTMPVTQFNMKWVEPAGMVKFDFLGLKTLTVIQKCVELLKNRDILINPILIPLNDVKTFELLSKGDATGVFQLESSGMRDVLRKMKPDCIEDIIALVALYRPGPMDNIPTYIDVKKGDKKADYLHPWLENTLRETHGVIIYQEQVMQIAQILSGYSLGEADLLRRAMGKKIKAEMDEQRLRFVTGAKEKQVDEKQAGSIFDLVAKFAGYGFNKSHAAAYAFISYQTAYLKANYPTEFMAAVMTYDMSNTDKLMVDKQEVARLKVKLIPPCVNQSESDFIVKDNQLHYALSAIKNVGSAAMQSLVTERKNNGLFADIYDFARRLDGSVMNKRTLEFLVKAGALDCFTDNRKQLMDSLDILVAESNHAWQEKTGGQNSLFGGGGDTVQNTPLVKTDDYPMLERLTHEHSALGFYLSAHPLDNMDTVLKHYNVMSYTTLCARLENTPKITANIAGVIGGKQERKSAKGNRYAFVGLSDSSGSFEVTVFSDQLEEYRDILDTGKSVILSIEATRENDQIRIRVNSIKDIQASDDIQNIEKIYICVNNIQCILPIKNQLSKTGHSQVFFVVNDNDTKKQAIIHLKQRYAISPAVQSTLQTIAGIVNIDVI